MEITMIKALEKLVSELLISHPITRDDDHKLACMVWIRELGGGDVVRGMDAWTFLAIFNKHELSNFKSISRCRRKLQELDEGLRGDKYKYRQQRKLEVKKSMLDWR